MHELRHSYASAIMRNGAPVLFIVEALGLSGTRMVEKHHAYLAPSYVAETLRRTAPDPDVTASSVVPLGQQVASAVSL